MREHVRNLKIIQLHVAKTGEEKAVNFGFVIITFRTRSENALLSNGGRRIMFVRLSEIPRKNAHSTTPRKKQTQKQTEITTRATYGSPSNYIAYLENGEILDIYINYFVRLMYCYRIISFKCCRIIF